MVSMRRLLATLAILILAACSKQKPIVVGSKNFTESVLLGEIVAQRLERAGCTVERKLDLGGTLVCDKAITSGSLDVYPEYSGTALTAILHHDAMRDRAAVMKRVAADYQARGLSWGPALGFENTFAMIVRTADAQRFSLKTISDLGRVRDGLERESLRIGSADNHGERVLESECRPPRQPARLVVRGDSLHDRGTIAHGVVMEDGSERGPRVFGIDVERSRGDGFVA